MLERRDRVVITEISFSLLIIIFVFGLGTNILFNSASALAATTDWQLITGPTVKVHAVIKPYINITINSPATIQSNLSVEGPAVVFDCNQGPGTYQSLSTNLLYYFQYSLSTAI